MDWPNWLSEARIAIIISLSSALFTGGTLIYTRRLAKNDTEKMRRKALIVEFFPHHGPPTRDGWDDYYLVIRNLEPVSARVTLVRSKPRGSAIIFTENHMIPQSIGSRLKDYLPEHQCEAIAMNISPSGTPKHRIGLISGDTITLDIMTKGVRTISDIEVAWEWSDGKKY